MSHKPILFCDFDGVLCHDRYWQSLPADAYARMQSFLFQKDNPLISDWMRGKYSAEQINQIISEKIGMPYQALWDIYIADCTAMQVSKDVLEKLHSLREQYTVILVTSNMDSFDRFILPALNLTAYFDHISNSFNEGLLKTDNNGQLYQTLAKKYGADIKDCIVFDDSKKVFDIFNGLGGTAYLVTPEQNISVQLDTLRI